MPAPEGVIAQTRLFIPAEVLAGISSGALRREGGVVRRVANGTIHTLLKEADAPVKAVQDAAARAARAHPKIMVLVVVAATTVGALAAGASLVARRRRNAEGLHAVPEVPEDVPECVRNFEASLRAYVDAARDGALDAGIVDRLIRDLDTVRAWVDADNAAEFAFRQLEPVFTLVIDHTATLARDYSVVPRALERRGTDRDAGIVAQMRGHLESQKQILGALA